MSRVIEHQDFNSREEFDGALLEQILPIEPDLVVLAGFMRILTNDFTKALSGKLINIHPSLLPDYPGLNTHQQAIENGDLMHGISVHYVSNKLDGGPIITQGALKIDPAQSEAKLISRIHKIEHAIYPKVIADIAKGYISLQGDQVKFAAESNFGPNHMEFFNV
jgi:phosphoribosylglycinamide formyltransferase-1